jgi:hypothetical protein
MARSRKGSSKLKGFVPQFLLPWCRQPQMSSTLLPQLVWLIKLLGPGACTAAVMLATASDPCRSAAPSAAVALPAAGLLTAANPQSAACAPEKTPCVSAKYTRACSSTCAQQGSEMAAASSELSSCQEPRTNSWCSGHYRRPI